MQNIVNPIQYHLDYEVVKAFFFMWTSPSFGHNTNLVSAKRMIDKITITTTFDNIRIGKVDDLNGPNDAMIAQRLHIWAFTWHDLGKENLVGWNRRIRITSFEVDTEPIIIIMLCNDGRTLHSLYTLKLQTHYSRPMQLLPIEGFVSQYALCDQRGSSLPFPPVSDDEIGPYLWLLLYRICTQNMWALRCCALVGVHLQT